MNRYSQHDWMFVSETVFDLINKELQDEESQRNKASLYVKLVSAMNFFRLLRGEGFYNQRPNYLGEDQKRLYQMEKELINKINDLKKFIDLTDPATRAIFDDAKKDFDLPVVVSN